MIAHVDHPSLELDSPDVLGQWVVVVQPRVENFLVSAELFLETDIGGWYLFVGAATTAAAATVILQQEAAYLELNRRLYAPSQVAYQTFSTITSSFQRF